MTTRKHGASGQVQVLAAAMVVMPLVVGCATSASSRDAADKDLAAARTAYQRASSGPAARINTAQLAAARQALATAESASGSSGHPDASAYVALRKAQVAEVMADALVAAERRNRTEIVLGMLERRHGDQSAAHEDRVRAHAAIDRLARDGALRQDGRGLVITLPAAKLFGAGRATLLAAAAELLDVVATALRLIPPTHTMTIEGHTDGRGTRDAGLALSRQQAETVRAYFVSRGVRTEALSARGVGPDLPVSDNRTVEGRATNRRIEIIISTPETMRSARAS